LWLAAEVDADHGLVIGRAPTLKDVEGSGTNAAKVDEYPRRLVDVDRIV
jgi:hypothetical protein